MVSSEPLSSSKEYAVNSRQYSFLLTPYCILLTHCCLLRGRFKGKGAVGGMSPFPVADSPETTPPGLGSNSLWLRQKTCIRGEGEEEEK